MRRTSTVPTLAQRDGLMAGAVIASSSGRRPGTMRIMPTSPPSRRPGPPWLEGRRRRLIGLTGLLLVLVAGTIGHSGFGLSLLDALFQTVITVSTVGFGEARPFGSGAKVFTIVLIFVGVATAAYTFGVGIETLVEGYLDGTFGRRRMERRISAMRGHMILCGWGRVGQAIARRAGGADMVVVDASAERIGTVSGPCVHGDATSEEVLRAAGIDRARVLVTALNADADNLYVTLTARSMAPGLFIVSRAGREAAVGELVQAGADRVVNPQDLGGARMAALAFQPHVAEFLDVIMHDGSLEFRLEEVEVPAGSPLDGQTLRSAGSTAGRDPGAGHARPGPGIPHQPAAHGADRGRGDPHRDRRQRPGGSPAGPGRRDRRAAAASRLRPAPRYGAALCGQADRTTHRG